MKDVGDCFEAEDQIIPGQSEELGQGFTRFQTLTYFQNGQTNNMRTVILGLWGKRGLASGGNEWKSSKFIMPNGLEICLSGTINKL